MPNSTTIEWRGATLTFTDSVWSDIVTMALQNKFAQDDTPDRAIRSDVCYVLAHLDGAKGLRGWRPVDDTATPEQFRECYKALMSSLDDVSEFYALVRAVNELKAPKAGPLDKPDEALTDEEVADPN